MKEKIEYLRSLKDLEAKNIDSEKTAELFKTVAYYYLETKTGVSIKSIKNLIILICLGSRPPYGDSVRI